MKKSLLGLVVCTALFVGCNDDQNPTQNQEEQDIDMSDFYLYTDAYEAGTTDRVVNGKNCSSMEVLNRQLNENPGQYKKMYDIEVATRRFINSKKPDGAGNGNGNGNGNGGSDGDGGDPVDDGLGTLNIPVYIYVIYSNDQQNISSAQINSQMAVLNADFNDTNFSDVRTEFQGLGADVEINFMTPVVDRQFNSTTSWGTNNAVKSAYPAQPGYLTMWVANIGGGILGYAQFPGGNASTDGVVMSPQYFGTTGFVSAPFDGGRTTTHEVGHWMNLRHIWGDGRCRQDDFVSDTPSSDGPNYSCDLNEVSCRSTDMVENYMDYSDDDCMGLFTEGQKARMRAIFAPGGARASLVGN
ncbi:zinc metalloprotease [Winogradskyella ursingii]|uniref:zinc metalloprotease n=1 Tax=Winogradskyella ursingii TaxID=2686079 RepID=UPI0015C91A4E|nr:zinc metalloprotease [Winogradskyella ursingii]